MSEQQTSQEEYHRQGLLANPDILDKYNAVYVAGAGEKVLQLHDDSQEPTPPIKEDESEIWDTWEGLPKKKEFFKLLKFFLPLLRHIII